MHKWISGILFMVLMVPLGVPRSSWGVEFYDDAATVSLIETRLYSQHVQDHLSYLSFAKTMLSSGQEADSYVNIWTAGALGHIKAGKGAHTVVTDDEPLMAGVDVKIIPSFIVGMSTIYNQADISLNSLNISGTLYTLGAVGYGEYRQTEDRAGFYANGLLGYMRHGIKGTATDYHGKQNSNQYLGAAEAGYRWPIQSEIWASARARFATAHLDTGILTQTNAAGSLPTVAGRADTHTAGTVLFSIEKTFEINDALSLLSDSITFVGDVGYTHIFENNPLVPHSLANLGLEAFIKPSESFGISLRGNFDVGNRYTSSLMVISLMYKW